MRVALLIVSACRSNWCLDVVSFLWSKHMTDSCWNTEKQANTHNNFCPLMAKNPAELRDLKSWWATQNRTQKKGCYVSEQSRNNSWRDVVWSVLGFLGCAELQEKESETSLLWSFTSLRSLNPQFQSNNHESCRCRTLVAPSDKFRTAARCLEQQIKQKFLSWITFMVWYAAVVWLNVFHSPIENCDKRKQQPSEHHCMCCCLRVADAFRMDAHMQQTNFWVPCSQRVRKFLEHKYLDRKTD